MQIPIPSLHLVDDCLPHSHTALLRVICLLYLFQRVSRGRKGFLCGSSSSPSAMPANPRIASNNAFGASSTTDQELYTSTDAPEERPGVDHRGALSGLTGICGAHRMVGWDDGVG